jgi:hypothetical protein
MTRPPQISRSFPLLTLAMAVPLVAILAFVAYNRYVQDDGPSDGWKTYRNERYSYELRYPPDWEIIEERDYPRGGGNEPIDIQYVVFARDPVDPAQPGVRPVPHVYAAVNFQGDWCTSTLGMSTTKVRVGGVDGEEHVCWLKSPGADTCTPQPRCVDVPWGLMRDIKRGEKRFWVFSDVDVSGDMNAAADYETTRKIVQSFRFVD